MRTSCRSLSIALAVLAIALAMVWAPGCGGRSGVSLASLDTTSGPRSGYQNVTIAGTGFAGVTGVSFGSTPAARFTVADATHIVAVTPAGELGRVVDVSVTTGSGTTTLRRAYTYWNYDLKLSKGTTTKTYTLDDVKAMAAATGFWGAVNDKPYNTDQYCGVPLLTLLDAVGGCGAGDEIVAASADGFTTVYTPEMLAQMAGGTYPMWNVNGTQIITGDRVAQLLLAYHIDPQNDGSSWQPLAAGKAPFRLVAATAQDDRMSPGPAGPALVVSIEVRAATAATPAAGAPAPAATTLTTTAAGSADGPAAGANALSITSLGRTEGSRSGYQNVTINGTGFDGVNGVSFGAVKAVNFTVADPTRIVAVTPPGQFGQTVDVRVSGPAGSVALAGAFTYLNYDLKLIKGSKVVTYTLDDLRAMPSVAGFWGAHKDPVPYKTDGYRGVPLLKLLDAVGGWSPGEDIKVTTADDFSIVYTTELLQQMAGGTYPMWSASGTEIITNDRFAQPIVAYDIAAQGGGGNWQPLEAGTGPLRMALVTTESDRVNQGKFNPFLAATIEVTEP